MKKKTMKIMSAAMVFVLMIAMTVTVFAAPVTKKDALNKALKDAKLTTEQVKRLSVEYDAKDAAYEIEFTKKSNRAEYDYSISAATGKITEKSVEYVYRKTSSKSKIGVTAARKKVASFSGISFSIIKTGTCRYSYENREGIYEVKFRKGNYKYEYDVQAATGKITEYEKELIRK